MNIIHKDRIYSLDNIKQCLRNTSQHHFIKDSQSGYIAYPDNNSFVSSLLLIENINNSILLIPYNDLLTNEENKRRCIKIKEQYSNNSKLAISTSGTKSKPKIVFISYNNIISHCFNFNKIIPLNKRSIWLNCLPLTHIAGVMIAFRCLFQEASMLLHDTFNAKNIWLDIDKFNISHISLVPIMLARLLDQSIDNIGRDTPPPASLKYILVGGGRLSNTLYQRAIKAGWPIYISYGMTEATSTIAIGRSPDQLKILDGFSTKLGPKGVLEIKGNMLSDSRIGNNKGAWFSTNDIVDLKRDYLNIIGRSDDVIISGGININPEFVKELILSSDQVNEFIYDLEIIKQSHIEWGETIVALVVGDVNRLESWVKENIKSLYQPRIFINVDVIPRDSLGKVSDFNRAILI